MKTITYFFFFLLFSGCTKKLYINCDSDNLFKTKFVNKNKYKYSQRTIHTKFSKEIFNKITNKKGVYYKEILEKYFYCNICFNSDENYIITYTGKVVKLGEISDPSMLAEHIISRLSKMELGAKEYENYIKKNKHILK